MWGGSGKVTVTSYSVGESQRAPCTPTTDTAYNLSSLIPNYKDLVYGQNMFVQINSVTDVGNSASLSYSYNATTGLFVVVCDYASYGSDYVRPKSLTVYVLEEYQ